jgi:hypothetical protein
MQDVEAGTPVQLPAWMRFLPSPDGAQRPVMQRIFDRYTAGRDADLSAFIAASKRVGHG